MGETDMVFDHAC